jgi:hypothetical protein
LLKKVLVLRLGAAARLVLQPGLGQGLVVNQGVDQTKAAIGIPQGADKKATICLELELGIKSNRVQGGWRY